MKRCFYANAVECGQLPPKQFVQDVSHGVFAGTGDDASRQVVSNQLLSLLTLRFLHFRVCMSQPQQHACVEWYLMSFLSQWPRTPGAVVQSSHHQPPRSCPILQTFASKCFVCPTLFRLSSICSVSSFSHRVLQQRPNGRSLPRPLDRCSQMRSGRQIRGACTPTFLLDSV